MDDLYDGVDAVLGFVNILISAELISGSSEYFVHMINIHVVIATTLIGLTFYYVFKWFHK